jgi:hypothetical protein
MALSPIERIRLDKAAVDEGFGLKRAADGDWLAYDSLGAPASIRLTCTEQNYLVAVNHPGVASDLSERWQKMALRQRTAGPGGFHGVRCIRHRAAAPPCAGDLAFGPCPADRAVKGFRSADAHPATHNRS